MQADFDGLEQIVRENPNSVALWNILHSHRLFRSRISMDHLAAHTYIIKLFTDAINDLSGWTTAMPAEKQNIWGAKTVPPSRVVKTNWVTTVFKAELAQSNQNNQARQSGNDIGSKFEVMDASDWRSDGSDRGTVTNSPT